MMGIVQIMLGDIEFCLTVGAALDLRDQLSDALSPFEAVLEVVLEPEHLLTDEDLEQVFMELARD